MAMHQSKVAYGPCDSFFVESEEGGMYTRQMEARDRAKALARERQRSIAEDLSRITSEDYQLDILNHMERMEAETLPDVNSIDIQTEIQWFMRPYLLDFLIEAHAAFSLLPETLYLTVNLLDRYCSKRVVYKRHYQLVGCAALLIASKYGDRKDRVPTIRELKSMCCSLYEDEMFTQMEWHVLQTLSWIVGHPTVDSFLQLSLSEVSYDPEVEHMAWYICEIALFHKEFVSTRPSVMSRSALALARCILSRQPTNQSAWSDGYDSNTVVMLSQHLQRPSGVLSRKYASNHLSSVSTKLEIFLQRQDQLARQAGPLTPPIEIHAAEGQKSNLSAYMPHTPQKGQFGNTQYGYLTPPITPDGHVCDIDTYGKTRTPTTYNSPATPTPPSSAGNSFSQSFNNDAYHMPSTEPHMVIQ